MGSHESKRDDRPPTKEEAQALADVIGHLSLLDREGQVRVLRASASFYSLPVAFPRPRPCRSPGARYEDPPRRVRTRGRQGGDRVSVAEATAGAQRAARASGVDLVRPRTQANVLAWAVDSFGATATDRTERAARLAEEAIEVAQAEGVSLDTLARISYRVFQGEPGEIGQEIGGVALTLQGMAEVAGLSVEDEAEREWRRVLSKTRDWWRRRHAAKVEAGTADLNKGRVLADALSGDALINADPDKLEALRAACDTELQKTIVTQAHRDQVARRNAGRTGDGGALSDLMTAKANLPQPEDMHGACDGFGGSDYPDPISTADFLDRHK